MRKLIAGSVLLAGFFALGCGGPDVTGSTGPLTDEEKRKIAAEDKEINDEESPGNKTLRTKPGRKK